MKMNKSGFEMSFAWMFAIIVGAVVLFIAVYAASNFVKTSRVSADTQVASQLGVLLNPLETGLESGKYAKITFPVETRIHNNCTKRGNFGEQLLGISTKSNIGEKWASPGIPTQSFNKYIFSSSIVEGKSIDAFSVPIEMPYKVADIIILNDKNYCFVSPPGEMEDLIKNLGGRLNVTDKVSDCPLNSKKVCFGQVGCDVDVNIQAKIVLKDGKSLDYEGNLIYGAIFSDKDLYECQVTRIARRAGEIARLYSDKAIEVAETGCNTNMADDLQVFAGQTNINSSLEIHQISQLAEDLGRKNNALACRLF